MAQQSASLVGKVTALVLFIVLGAGILAPYLDGRVSIIYGFVFAPAAMLALLYASIWLARQPLPRCPPQRSHVSRALRAGRLALVGCRQRLSGMTAHRHLPFGRST